MLHTRYTCPDTCTASCCSWQGRAETDGRHACSRYTNRSFLRTAHLFLLHGGGLLQACPFLLRVFPKFYTHYRPGDFDRSRVSAFPEGELNIYTWCVTVAFCSPVHCTQLSLRPSKPLMYHQAHGLVQVPPPFVCFAYACAQAPCAPLAARSSCRPGFPAL